MVMQPLESEEDQGRAVSLIGGTLRHYQNQNRTSPGRCGVLDWWNQRGPLGPEPRGERWWRYHTVGPFLHSRDQNPQEPRFQPKWTRSGPPGSSGAKPARRGTMSWSDRTRTFRHISVHHAREIHQPGSGPVRVVLWEPAPPAALRCFQVNMFGFSSDNYRVLVPPTQTGRYKNCCSPVGSDPAAPKRTSTPSRYTHTHTHTDPSGGSGSAGSSMEVMMMKLSLRDLHHHHRRVVDLRCSSSGLTSDPAWTRTRTQRLLFLTAGVMMKSRWFWTSRTLQVSAIKRVRVLIRFWFRTYCRGS
ncbi:hypothetical protein CCH79_00020926 [Gambusia affinis]|uniref:Uncharacterized protein n=1 Tax=Gambusia affinis TaxID=33528 RepID=A0A315W9Q2_GAMAF|nr:hypothetical protein CCH79_00020926 [Gambusia affinis]